MLEAQAKNILKKTKTSLFYLEKEMPSFSYHRWLGKGRPCWTAPNAPVWKLDPFLYQEFGRKFFYTNWEIEVSVDLTYLPTAYTSVESPCVLISTIQSILILIILFRTSQSIYSTAVLKKSSSSISGFFQPTVVSVIYYKPLKDQSILIHFDHFLVPSAGQLLISIAFPSSVEIFLDHALTACTIQ